MSERSINIGVIIGILALLSIAVAFVFVAVTAAWYVTLLYGAMIVMLFSGKRPSISTWWRNR